MSKHTTDLTIANPTLVDIAQELGLATISDESQVKTALENAVRQGVVSQNDSAIILEDWNKARDAGFKNANLQNDNTTATITTDGDIIPPATDNIIITTPNSDEIKKEETLQEGLDILENQTGYDENAVSELQESYNSIVNIYKTEDQTDEDFFNSIKPKDGSKVNKQYSPEQKAEVVKSIEKWTDIGNVRRYDNGQYYVLNDNGQYELLEENDPLIKDYNDKKFLHDIYKTATDYKINSNSKKVNELSTIQAYVDKKQKGSEAIVDIGEEVDLDFNINDWLATVNKDAEERLIILQTDAAIEYENYVILPAYE